MDRQDKIIRKSIEYNDSNVPDDTKIPEIYSVKNNDNLDKKNFSNFVKYGENSLTLSSEKSYGSFTSNGEYLIPSTISEKIISDIYDGDSILKLCNIFQTNQRKISVPIDTEDLKAKWIKDGEAFNENPNNNTLSKIDITSYDICACVTTTPSLLKTSSIENWIYNRVVNFLKHQILMSLLNGKGDGSNELKGILTHQAKVKRTEQEKFKIIDIFEIKTEDSLFANMLEVVHSVPSSIRGGSCWLLSSEFLKFLFENMSDKIKNTIFLSQEDGIMKIFQYPVYVLDNVFPKKDKHAIQCIFGNLKEGYTLLYNDDISMLRDPYSQKSLVQFFTSISVGGGVVNPNAIKFVKMPVN